VLAAGSPGSPDGPDGWPVERANAVNVAAPSSSSSCNASRPAFDVSVSARLLREDRRFSAELPNRVIQCNSVSRPRSRAPARPTTLPDQTNRISSISPGEASAASSRDASATVRTVSWGAWYIYCGGGAGRGGGRRRRRRIHRARRISCHSSSRHDASARAPFQFLRRVDRTDARRDAPGLVRAARSYVCVRCSGHEHRGFRRPQWTPAPSPTPIPASPFRIKGEKSRGASLRHCITCRCGWSACGRHDADSTRPARVSLSLNYSLARAPRDGRRAGA